MVLSVYFEELQQYNSFRTAYAMQLHDAHWGAYCVEQIQNQPDALLWVLLYLEWASGQQTVDGVNDEEVKWLNRFPHSVKLVVDMSRYWLQKGKADQAEQLLRAYLKQFNDEAMLWFVLAEILSSKGHQHAALECCDRVLQAQPQHAEALRLCAQIAMHLGDADQAVRAVDASLRSDPSNIEGLIMRGMLYDVSARHGRGEMPKHALVLGLYQWGHRLSGWQGWMLSTAVFVLWWWICGGDLTWDGTTIATGMQLYTACAMVAWVLIVLGQLAEATFGQRILSWTVRDAWPLVPLFIWMAITSLRYSTDDSEWSFGLDFIRSFAYCCFVPILAWCIFDQVKWIALLARWTIALTMVCFAAGVIGGHSEMYILAFVVAGVFACSYLLRDWLWAHKRH